MSNEQRAMMWMYLVLACAGAIFAIIFTMVGITECVVDEMLGTVNDVAFAVFLFPALVGTFGCGMAVKELYK